jgi:hypothetical protein
MMSENPVPVVSVSAKAGALIDPFTHGSTTIAPQFAPMTLALLTYHSSGAAAVISTVTGASGNGRTVSPFLSLMVSVS